MKRKVSLFVAAVMMLSMLPSTGASAATLNKLASTVGSTATDKDWSDTPTTAAVLDVEYDTANSLGVGKSFSVKLSNAEWTFKDMASANALGAGAVFTSGAAVGGEGQLVIEGPNKVLGKYTLFPTDKYTVKFYSTTEAEVTINRGEQESNQAIKHIYIPLVVEMKGAGPATVRITDSSGANVTDSTLTFATGTDGGAIASVSSKKNTAGDFTLSGITIEETVAGKIETGSMSTNELSLRAPAGYNWGTKNSVIAAAKTEFFGGFASSSHNGNWRVDNTDDTTVRYTLAGHSPEKSQSSIGKIIVSGLTLYKEDDATLGKLVVGVTAANAGSFDVEVGELIKRTVTMVAEDKTLPEIISGTYTKLADKDENKTVKLTIKEGVRGAWNVLDGQVVLVPSDGVKFRAVKINSVKNIPNPWSSVLKLENTGTANANISPNSKVILKDNKLTIKNIGSRNSNDGAGEMEIQLWVTTKPGYEGDVTISTHADDNDAFAGALSATVAKSVNPLTFTAENTTVPLGKTGIKLADVTIKENKAGALKKSEQSENYGYHSMNSSTTSPSNTWGWYDDYNFWVGYSNSGVGFNADLAKAEVVAGNVVVDELKASGSTIGTYSDFRPLVLKIKRASTTPSELKLTGLTADTRRDLADGEYDLRVNGLLTANYKGTNNNSNYSADMGSFDVDYVTAIKNYVTINGGGSPIVPGGPTSGSTFTKKVVFKIGSTDYTVDATDMKAPSAPFISNNSTYVPIRPIMDMIGLQDKDYQYDVNSKTLTLYNTPKGTVQMQSGATEMVVNGAKVAADETMPVAILTRDNRIFVPFRAIGKLVLNCEVSYDSSTKEVKYN